jgi:hypothetical protein
MAETDYEKKLEYRRKKIQIMIKTAMKGETTAYADTDTWSSTISPEAGYSYTYSTGSTRSGSTVMVNEVTNWVAIRGGVRELSDVELLEIAGNREEAREVQAKIDERGMWNVIGATVGLLGLGVAIAGSSSGDSGTIVAGSIVSLIGFIASSFNMPKKHYIAADYALELTDKYNIKLKKDLGLPVEFE